MSSNRITLTLAMLSVLVVAGPSNDLLAQEIDLLRAYLENGGKMLVLLDPPDSADAPNPENLMGLLQEWGIEVGRDIVVDFSGVGQLLGTDAATPVAASYPLRCPSGRGSDRWCGETACSSGALRPCCCVPWLCRYPCRRSLATIRFFAPAPLFSV